MTIGWQRITVMGVTALALCLAGCGDAHAPASTPTEAPKPPGPTELECPIYLIYWEISTEEYEWAVEVLENIEPGVTQFDEVGQLLGRPTAVLSDGWWFDPGLGAVGLNVFWDDEDTIVDWMILANPMTLGQLVEMYGAPSRVYRSEESAPEKPAADSLPLTYLFYDEHHLVAGIQQGLCSFPPHLPVDYILVTSGSIDDLPILSSNAVEIEWPGLMAEESE